MTADITLSLTILLVAVALFLSEKIRFDLIALLVLVALSLSGLLTPSEAFSGFSNPAVITVWAVFILSGGLSRTGLANMVGRQVLRVAGDGEVRLIVVIMITAGFMSAFMNNVGVAAMLLPIVVDIAHRTRRPASKLLMPLAFGSLLGGLITLIGTPPNILASASLESAGFTPFRFFDFAPLGLTVALAGVAYMALIGRRLLPAHDLASTMHDPAEIFDLEERLFSLKLPPDSLLGGKSLADSRIGSALGLTVLAVVRDQDTQLAPHPDMPLQPGDRLLVSGRARRLRALADQPHLEILSAESASSSFPVEQLTSDDIRLVEILVPPASSFCGRSLVDLDFRSRFGAIVLAMLRRGKSLTTDLQDIPIQAEDRLLL
ncbi:MAG: SLC13 family permease, partial [Anaerolineae bacterium]|nr:SLC13 family permease [Anaerolineae bacterium]